MTASQPSYDDVTRRLAEAEQTLDAIRSGNVDAFVVSTHGGPQIYTLESADVLYRLLIEQMPEGAAALTADGTIVFANQTFADMLGHEVSELLACNLMDFAHSADRDLLERLLTSRSEFASTEIQLGAEPGPVLLLSVRSVGDFPDSLLCVVAVDQTERIRAERALKAAEERFRSAFDDAPIGMALLDETGVTERVNAALLEITGLGMADIVGSRLPWLPRESDDDFVIRDGMIEVNLRHGPDLGDDIWVAAQTTAVRDDDDQLRHTIVQVLDITQRRRSEASLRYVADHDGLTGLVNRRGFEIAMQRHLSLADRHHVDGALILLDVDHFKYINDARGHHVGDLVLSALATALGERLRTSDVMGRLGGDEFAILVPFTSLDAARGLAEELVRTAADLQITELVGLRQLTVSAGVAPLEHEGRSFGELMALADLALYDAKDAGRNRVAVYDPSHQGASETEQRMTWLARIKEALDTDSLVVHAQPIVELATGKTVHYELLVRMPGPDDAIIPAASWFSIAERYDLATAIDMRMFDQAIAMLCRYDGAAVPGLNVNVSALSIGRADLIEHIRTGLAGSGVAANRLTFEITETAAFSNLAAAARFVEELHALGCRLALDDFGAGFGSFYYLKHLAFDDVKIDGEFVRNSVNDFRDQSIITAMVAVAGSMGRRTVAESVEDEATLELLARHGVDLAQGYHLGKPEPLQLD